MGEEISKRFLFCNVTYMKYYNVDIVNDVPVNGGEYVRIHKDALEKYNFHDEDGYYYGFVETGYTDGYESGKRPRLLNIENIDKSFEDENEIEDVLVIFCAKSNDLGKTVIVGWYNHATVYRDRQGIDWIHQYNLKAKVADSYLVPVSKRWFEVPNARTSTEHIGFGRSQIWYAKGDGAENDYVQAVYEYIGGLINSENVEELNIPETISEQELHAQGMAYEELVSLVGKMKNYEPQKRKIENSYQYERNPYVSQLAQKRADGICQLCKKPAPFIKKDGTPYLETHHIIWLSNGGLDSEENTVALCPNCHRKMHNLNDEKDVQKLKESNTKMLIKAFDSVVGKEIEHERFGKGTIVSYDSKSDIITVEFIKEKKMLLYTECISKKKIRFI